MGVPTCELRLIFLNIHFLLVNYYLIIIIIIKMRTFVPAAQFTQDDDNNNNAHSPLLLLRLHICIYLKLGFAQRGKRVVRLCPECAYINTWRANTHGKLGFHVAAVATPDHHLLKSIINMRTRMCVTLAC
jgi:hypothetical protein